MQVLLYFFLLSLTHHTYRLACLVAFVEVVFRDWKQLETLQCV